ncbi:hypothetical protein CLCOS_17970 [Clostridium coskatii]|uniref:Uncharacterized protein n=1 Tax=Clostridium coskatii TaxID=1705578 RepID=A0A162L8L2_9CLOT|nr:hypothetical protein WX73_00724 [Clostridium coskatii]OBR94558.1 hypothetical protein CLCOS_17970 [Clostridium coskatii]
MDYKDILVLVIVIVFILFGEKLFPNNPLSAMINYIKCLFTYKS